MESLHRMTHFEYILCYFSIVRVATFLEIVLSSKAARGFESLPLRHAGPGSKRLPGPFFRRLRAALFLKLGLEV